MIPSEVDDKEELGRELFSSKDARHRIPVHAFMAKPEPTIISVDRLDFALHQEMTKIGERNATARGGSFYGWAVLVAKIAKEDNRVVESAPEIGNQYHANIILPNNDLIKLKHVKDLANASSFKSPL